jgi:hypothetical protein
MAVLALNQRQPLAGTQFVATFSGVAIDDVLVISLEDVDIVFDESANIPFLDLVSRTNGEVRVHVLTEKVQAEVNTFSFQIRASASLNRSWVLNNPNSQESYQVYATTISAGKTLELLEFSREGEGWAIRSANQTIGEVAPPADELVYPEHLRDLGLAHTGLALEQERPLQGHGEEHRGGEPLVGDVAVRGERFEHVGGSGGRNGH